MEGFSQGIGVVAVLTLEGRGQRVALGLEHQAYAVLLAAFEERGHMLIVLLLQAGVFGPALFVNGHHDVFAEDKTSLASGGLGGQKQEQVPHAHAIMYTRIVGQARRNGRKGAENEYVGIRRRVGYAYQALEEVREVVPNEVGECGKRFRRFLCRNRHFRHWRSWRNGGSTALYGDGNARLLGKMEEGADVYLSAAAL